MKRLPAIAQVIARARDGRNAHQLHAALSRGLQERKSPRLRSVRHVSSQPQHYCVGYATMCQWYGPLISPGSVVEPYIFHSSATEPYKSHKPTNPPRNSIINPPNKGQL